MRYTMGDASKIMSFTPTLNGLELHPLVSDVLQENLPIRSNAAARVCIFAYLFFQLIWVI